MKQLIWRETQDSAGGLGVHTGTSHWQPVEASPPSVTHCVGNQTDGLMCGDRAIERRNPCRGQPGRQIDFSTSCHYDLKINHKNRNPALSMSPGILLCSIMRPLPSPPLRRNRGIGRWAGRVCVLKVTSGQNTLGTHLEPGPRGPNWHFSPQEPYHGAAQQLLAKASRGCLLPSARASVCAC